MTKTALSRRQFIKIFAAAGGLLVGGDLLLRALAPGLAAVRETRDMMGAVLDLTLVTYDEAVGKQAIRMTLDEMERLVGIFNHRFAGSPLARLNRQGELPDPPQELAQVMAQAVRLGEQTGGAFDVTVKPLVDLYLQAQKDGQGLPDEASLQQALALVDYRKLRVNQEGLWLQHPGMQVTLDGIARGYILDCGVAVLRGLGFENLRVEVGGDLQASGQDGGRSPWRVEVPSPRPGSRPGLLEKLDLRNRAAATSADYVHAFSKDYAANQILDPRTGHSPPELASATVVGDNATQCDGLATALMVLGRRAGLALVESLAGFEACLVTKDLQMYKSSGLEDGPLA